MILAGWPIPEQPSDCGVEGAHAECRYCKTAIHDGDCCIECWRDLRELGIARDREWWAA